MACLLGGGEGQESVSWIQEYGCNPGSGNIIFWTLVVHLDTCPNSTADPGGATAA